MAIPRTGRIGVVGGGLGGLAAACVLAARGYAVTLFEKSPWLGGKAAVLEEQGYRFDMGPTILTLPSVLRRIFAEAGQNLDEVLTLVPCQPQWRSFFSDKATLDLVADRQAMSQNLERFAPGTSKGYGAFLDFSETLHTISNRFFFWRSIGSLWDMFDLRSMFQLSILRDVLKMRMGKTVAEAVRAHVPEPRVAQMIDHFTQYVGSAPDLSPAVLCGIAHMQTQEGIWYPLGGTGAVPKALAKLALELGVELRTGTGVRRILFEEAARQVTGIETDNGEQIPFAAVISNADSVRTHRELLHGVPQRRFEKRRSYEPACSGVVLYLGLDRAYDHLAHHNFVFSRDAHEEFEWIYKKGEPAPDPTCYVCAPSRSEPGVAPPGGEALYILVHTPYLRPHHDWKQMLPSYRETILRKLATTGDMADLERRIRFEAHLTPQDIHDRYRVLNGAIYGLASHGRMMGAFKPANRSPDIRGLYLAGGAAHPGPGMPMVLMSGWIAADTLDRDGVVDRGSSAPSLSHVAQPGKPAAKEEKLPQRSAWRVRVFTRLFRHSMSKNFHAVRLSKRGKPPPRDGRPLIVVLNHPGWWDPLMGMVLADLFEGYKHYVPIDAAALAQYRIFEPMGFFGVEVGTPEGALAFLRTSKAILSHPQHALWITAQGKFTDPRIRPVELRQGVGHLVRRLENAVLLPLAIEYPFWQERYPEALAHFGSPIEINHGRACSVEAWMSRIETGLTEALDALAQEAQTQEADRFETLVGGSVGIGGVYDVWRRFKARLRGQRFHASHVEGMQQGTMPRMLPGELS
jgi:phytoene desaturase